MSPVDGDQVAFVDIKLLRLFDLLYATRSVTRAALQLGQKQPTVSIWLGQLRHHFHDPLFVRTPEGMRPTRCRRADPAGARGGGPFAPAFRMAAELRPGNAERRFTIAMANSSHITLLPKLWRILAPRRPASNWRWLASAPTRPKGCAPAPSASDRRSDRPAGALCQQTLFTQDWVCLARRRHPRIGVRLDRERYEAEAHVDVMGGMRQQLLESAVEANRVRRRATLVLPGYLGLARILAATDLIATLPRHIATTLAEGRELALQECPFQIPSFSTRRSWHARYHHDEANRWLRTACATLFAGTFGPPPG